MERMKFMKYWRNLIYTPCGFDIIFITRGVNSSNFCTLTKKAFINLAQDSHYFNGQMNENSAKIGLKGGE